MQTCSRSTRKPKKKTYHVHHVKSVEEFVAFLSNHEQEALERTGKRNTNGPNMTIPRCTRQSSLIVPESLTSFTNTLMEIGHGHLLGSVCFESMTTLGVECYFKEIVYSTTEPNKSTEHRETQGGSVHCTVVAVQVSRLLSTI